jgi:hypothetical protein
LRAARAAPCRSDSSLWASCGTTITGCCGSCPCTERARWTGGCTRSCRSPLRRGGARPCPLGRDRSSGDVGARGRTGGAPVPEVRSGGDQATDGRGGRRVSRRCMGCPPPCGPRSMLWTRRSVGTGVRSPALTPPRAGRPAGDCSGRRPSTGPRRDPGAGRSASARVLAPLPHRVVGPHHRATLRGCPIAADSG